MLRWISCLFALVLVAGPVPSWAGPLPAACALPQSLLVPDAPLKHLGVAIRAGGPISILAIGSASTVGVQLAADRTGAFPYRAVAALQAALPKTVFDLTVQGGRGMTAEDMLPLLHRALAARRYNLVFWQTGTVEAVRGLPPNDMGDALQEGIGQALATGADVVLIDSQFSRFLRANADLEPYEQTLEQMAVLSGVVLFRRYDAMQDWADAGTIDLERASRRDRVRMMALLNTCLGDALARFVLNGAGQPAP